jgi:hypothetical protein
MRSRHPREVWPIFQRDMNIQRLDRKNIFFLALFLIFGAILAWRAPRLLLAPRFWAEEGSVYFKFAYEHSFLRALFFVYWEAGYLYLLVNVVTAIAAHLLPLEYAPFATVYTALVIQLVPFLIILYGKSSVFTSIRKKITACLVFLFLPNLTHTLHTWLNLLNSQVWLGLIAVLILLENLESASSLKRWTYRIFLAMGGLSGAYVSLLQPVFAIRALAERRKERLVQLGIVTIGLLLQVGLALISISQGALKGSENIRLGSHILTDISLHHIGTALLGYDTASGLAKALGSIGNYIFFILFLSTLPITLSHRIRNGLKLKDTRTILVIALLLLMTSTTLAACRVWSLNVPLASRYTILSGFVLLFLIIDNISMPRRPYMSWVFVLLLFISLLTGMWRYRKYPAFRDGKYWKAAVVKARQGPDDTIRIPPFSRLNLKLRTKISPERVAPKIKDADTKEDSTSGQ